MSARHLFMLRLQGAARAAGIQPRQLAERSGVSLRFIESMIHDHVDVELDVAERLATALGFTLAEMLDQPRVAVEPPGLRKPIFSAMEGQP